MIAENGYLISKKRRKTFCPDNNYLLIATDVQQEIREKGDEIDYQLDSLTTRINNHADSISASLVTRFESFREESKKDFETVLEGVREDNLKLIAMIEELSARLPPANQA